MDMQQVRQRSKAFPFRTRSSCCYSSKTSRVLYACWYVHSFLFLPFSLQSNTAVDPGYHASHLHNLSHPDIAVDLATAHIRFETAFQNTSERKLHQSGEVSCNHDPEIQCRFGLVTYADASRANTGFSFKGSKREWLKKHVDTLMATSAQPSLSTTGMGLSPFAAFQITDTTLPYSSSTVSSSPGASAYYCSIGLTRTSRPATKPSFRKGYSSCDFNAQSSCNSNTHPSSNSNTHPSSNFNAQPSCDTSKEKPCGNVRQVSQGQEKVPWRC
jgi:hypothetical protein